MVCCCGVERVLVVLGSCVGDLLYSVKTRFAPVYLDPPLHSLLSTHRLNRTLTAHLHRAVSTPVTALHPRNTLHTLHSLSLLSEEGRRPLRERKDRQASEEAEQA